MDAVGQSAQAEAARRWAVVHAKAALWLASGWPYTSESMEPFGMLILSVLVTEQPQSVRHNSREGEKSESSADSIMDPVSVVGLVTGIVTLTRLLDETISGLANFLARSRNVDQTVQSFVDDIEALSVILGSVSARFRCDESLAQPPNSQASLGAISSLSISVAACQRLINSLHGCIPRRRTSSGKENFLQRMFVQRRLAQNRDTMRVLHGQIQMHTGIINTAINLLIFDSVTQSSQSEITRPYRNLVGSLQELQRAGTRFTQTNDAESVAAFQTAMVLSTTAETVLSETVSVVGHGSNATDSIPRATPSQNPGSPGQPSHEATPDTAPTPRTAVQECAPQRTSNGPGIGEQPQISSEPRASPEHELGDSGYGSSLRNDPLNPQDSIMSVSAEQLRLETRRLLQSHGHPIDKVGPLKMSSKHRKALTWAASEGHCDAVKYLIEQGAGFDLQSETAAAPLFVAIHSGHTDVVKLLLSLISGADLRSSMQAHNALSAAARRGEYSILAMMLDRDADPNFRNHNEGTPLHVAAQAGQLNMVKHLLLKNADVFAKDEKKRTPLHIAVESGSLAVTRLLLERRSEINVKNSSGDSPFHVAFRSASLEIFSCLVEFGAKVQLANDEFVRSSVLDELLNGKLRAGFRAFVECLHKQNLFTYFRIEEVVHYISKGNHKDALKYLCGVGVLTGPHTPNYANDRSAIDEKRKHLFATASLDTIPSLPAYEEYYRHSGVDVLYQQGDNLEDQSERNEQVLRSAVDSRDGRLFRDTLNQMKPNPGHPQWPISANTLCHVVQKGDIGMLQALFWTKVDIDGTNSDGWAAIHYAAYNPNMFDKLITLHSFGANINVETSAFRDGHEAGETALGLALRRQAENVNHRTSNYWHTMCLALHARGAHAGNEKSSRNVRLANGDNLHIPTQKKVLRKKFSSVPVSNITHSQ